MNTNLVCAFDVDGTLIDYQGKPRYEIISLFHTLEKMGCHMVIWSGGGPDYARHIMENLGLKAEIKVKGSFTPDVAFDDQVVQLGGVNFQVPTPGADDAEIPDAV